MESCGPAYKQGLINLDCHMLDGRGRGTALHTQSWESGKCEPRQLAIPQNWSSRSYYKPVNLAHLRPRLLTKCDCDSWVVEGIARIVGAYRDRVATLSTQTHNEDQRVNRNVCSKRRGQRYSLLCWKPDHHRQRTSNRNSFLWSISLLFISWSIESMSQPRLHLASSQEKSNNENSCNIVHHPWKVEKAMTGASPSAGRGGGCGSSSGNASHNIDRFLTRSKRRKHPSWGSDSSTIFTESTGQSSQSSLKSVPTSPIPVRKAGEGPFSSSPGPVSLVSPSHGESGLEHRDQRGTIGSVEIVLRRQHQPSPKSYPIDVDSLEECHDPPKRPGPDRGLVRWETTDTISHRPPRSPRRPTTPPRSRSPIRTRRVALPPPPPPHQPHFLRKVHPPKPPVPSVQTGPIDVDSLETYKEDASVDSLAMMNIIEESDNSEDLSVEWTSSKPPVATRQRTNSSSLDTSLSPDDISIQSASSAFDDEDYDGDDEEHAPLDSLMKLEKLDLLAESDSEEDYSEIRRQFHRFPILDEGEAQRVLCGYVRGFEPPVETVDVFPTVEVTPRRKPRKIPPSPRDPAFEI